MRTMEIFNEVSREAIAYAYDNLKRDEFLNRMYTFIGETVENVRLQERLRASSVESSERLMNTHKTKPGPRAKESKENGQGELTGV